MRAAGARGCAACVALLAEGVDRNLDKATELERDNRSPSSRRAWIEMAHAAQRASRSACRPPRGGRG